MTSKSHPNKKGKAPGDEYPLRGRIAKDAVAIPEWYRGKIVRLRKKNRLDSYGPGYYFEDPEGERWYLYISEVKLIREVQGRGKR